MTDRWFNELTHKYLEYVRLCHVNCDRNLLQYDLRNEFEDIKNNNLQNDKEKVEAFAEFLHEALKTI